MAAVALLMIGATPVAAAPGGVPGPPPGHEKSKGEPAEVEEVEDGEIESSVPEWAKAYGKRIKDAYGVPFGHLQQCAGMDDVDPAEDTDDTEDTKKALENCPEDLEFPEDGNGAKAFWVFTEDGLAILAI